MAQLECPCRYVYDLDPQPDAAWLTEYAKVRSTHDLQATILHLLGIDHTHLTFNQVGRDFRLTDIHGSVVQEFLA
jgi:hypothetical protein